MGRDFEPSSPRPVIIDLEQGDTGDPTSVLEIPVSWYLDDWPSQEFVMGIQTGLASANSSTRPGRITSTTPASVCRTGRHDHDVPQCIGRETRNMLNALSACCTHDVVRRRLVRKPSDVFHAWHAASGKAEPSRFSPLSLRR